MWYEDIWNWIKKYWAIVLSAVTFFLGWIVGKERRTGTYLDIKRLRKANKELKRRTAELRQQVETLRSLDARNKEELADIEVHLAEAERAVRLLRQQLNESGADTAELGATNRRLREYIDKYGERLKEITVED